MTSKVPFCQDLVVVRALVSDLSGHAVESLRALFGTCEQHVGDRTGDPAVSIIEWVHRDEPQVGQRGLQHVVRLRRGIEPVKKDGYLVIEPAGRERFEMNTLAPNRTGDNLHRAGCVVTPCAGPDASHSAAARREQRSMPRKKPFRR